MSARCQLCILISFLLITGIGLTLYKCAVLGFMFSPEGTETVWQVQGRIQFEAAGGPAKISLTMPVEEQSRRTVFQEKISDDYKCVFVEEEGIRKAVWTRKDAQNTQVIYFRGDFYHQGVQELDPPLSTENPYGIPTGPGKLAARDILLRARVTATSNLDIALRVIGLMGAESKSPSARILLKNVKYRREHMEQVAKILAMDGIQSRVVRGLLLKGSYTQRSITTFIRVYTGDRWALLDPNALAEIAFNEALLWPEGTRGLLDVYGGSDSHIDLSVTSIQKNAGNLAIDAGKLSGSALIDFSIFSLPIRDQNTFKLLLLIPLGALVVVILRNLVGIRTSGTFMPILIALTFMQTTLLLGLLLFLIVVSVGLVMRSYLSHLNLLLVPRIASVLVFVIIIFAAIGIASHKLGWESGLAITFFPMIILSWTIERMSILWEEEGPKEVLIQSGGSLFTASLAYLVMINPNVAHLAFNFPELLLVLLAIIIMIGSYSGFRLLELTRFEPMTRVKK